MEKNRLLNFALGITNIMRIIFIMLIVLMTFVFVHWHLSPESYKNIGITIDKTDDVVYVYTDNAYLVAPNDTNPKFGSNNKENIQLTQINHRSFYTYYLRNLGNQILLFLIFVQLKNIIQSVKALETFRSDNSKAFRKIGVYCLAIALLNTFKWYTIDYTFFGIYFKFTPLAFALVAFILAEIFKEGNKLYEAEQLTI